VTDYLIGADEVGRGCLAGDLHVCAVMVPVGLTPVEGVTDSKALTPARRTQLYWTLTKTPELRLHVARATPEEIDANGMARALRRCFRAAVQYHLDALGPDDQVLKVMVDGNPFPLDLDAPVRFVVRGDSKEWVIGAASIIAKVERDAWMVQLAPQHPGYGWERNKGYGSSEHIAGIEAKGLTDYHRATFCTRFKKPGDEEPDDDPIGSLFG